MRGHRASRAAQSEDPRFPACNSTLPHCTPGGKGPECLMSPIIGSKCSVLKGAELDVGSV